MISPSGTESCYTSSSSAPDGLCVSRLEVRCPHHVRRLQVLQSKCLRLVTGAPWYLSSRQIHEDLGVPFLAEHIRALTASVDPRLADVEKPLVRQLGRYLPWPRAGPVSKTLNRERRVPADQSRSTLVGGKSTKRIVLVSDLPSTFRPP